MIALDEVVDLVEVQSASDFKDIQFWEDEEFPVDVLEDLIDIDGPEDDIKDNGLSNKPLDKSFYPILSLSVYNYLDYIDFFIFIRFKGVGKRVITVITAIPVTAGTPLATTTETTVTPGTRLNQINPLKDIGNTLDFKVRFYNDIIVIKKSNNIDITTLNDKATIPETTTLEISQPVNQILEYEEITYL